MKFKKKIHIIMSIISSLLLIGTMISSVLLILGYNNNDIATISFVCFICGLMISLAVHFAIIWTINTNTKDLLAINKCVIELESNKQLCKACNNYVDSHCLPMMTLECMFLPFVYNGFRFKICKAQVDIYNTNYLKQFKISTDEHFDFSEIISNRRLYLYSGRYKNINRPINKGNTQLEIVYDGSDELDMQFYELNNLFTSLINQKIINVPNDRDHYLAFIYLLYLYTKKKFFSQAQERVENLGLSITDNYNAIIEALYDNDYDIGIIATTLYSLFSHTNQFIDLSNIHYYKYEKLATSLINGIKEKRKIESLLSESSKKIPTYSIEDIDLMSGADFESFVTYLFNQLGYKASNTKLSGDQGIDVIAKKGQSTIAIQCKCFHGSVGNHAIMEAYAGAKYYNADKCMVVTNSVFTKSAKELANKNGVVLWDRKMLIEKLSAL